MSPTQSSKSRVVVAPKIATATWLKSSPEYASPPDGFQQHTAGHHLAGMAHERLGERELAGARGRESPKGLVATLPGIEDRDAAEAMRGTEVWVPRSALPPPSPGEYYWVDLEGLRVANVEGVEFGTVSHLFSTGANDVLVARGERERMIPFIQPDYIVSVDFDARCITVDWDAEF